MARRDFCQFFDDFEGARVFTAGAVDSKGIWHFTDTSAAGSPTVALVDGAAEAGECKITLAATNEVENLCLSQNDILWLPIDRILSVAARVKQSVTTLDASVSWAIGLAGDRNDAIDSIAQNCLFRGIGSNAIVVETDDGTTDNDDVATGRSMSTSYHDLEISFAKGKSDIRFFIDGQPVATGTTFSMAAYSGALQLYAQLQKTASTAVDAITIDWIEVVCRRGIVRP